MRIEMSKSAVKVSWVKKTSQVAKRKCGCGHMGAKKPGGRDEKVVCLQKPKPGFSPT